MAIWDLALPPTEKDDPSLEIARRLKVEPKDAASRTLRDEPNLPKHLRLIEDPK
jgi:hypothetical protein